LNFEILTGLKKDFSRIVREDEFFVVESVNIFAIHIHLDVLTIDGYIDVVQNLWYRCVLTKLIDHVIVVLSGEIQRLSCYRTLRCDLSLVKPLFVVDEPIKVGFEVDYIRVGANLIERCGGEQRRLIIQIFADTRQLRFTKTNNSQRRLRQLLGFFYHRIIDLVCVY